jgi:hypothetical protein
MSSSNATTILLFCRKMLGIISAGFKAADLITDEVFSFNLPNPFSRTMALGSTQSLTKMSTRNLPGGKRRPARMADLIAMCEPIC